MTKLYKVLVLGELVEIDDNFSDRLSREHYSVKLITVKDIDEFRRAIKDPDIDIIVIDIDPYGLAVLDAVMEKTPMRPMIIVGDAEHVNVLLEAKKIGMQRTIIRVEDLVANKSLLLWEINTVLKQLAEPPTMKYITVDNLMRYAQYHNVHEPLFVVDMNGRLIYFNQAGNSLIHSLEGRDANIGDSQERFLLAETLEKFDAHLTRAFLGEEFRVEQVFESLGEVEKYREILYQPVSTPEQGVVAVSIACRNVRARHLGAEKFERREEELWSYFELVPLPLVFINADLVVEHSNSTYQDLLGIEAGQSIQGKKIDDFVVSEDQAELNTLVQRVLNSELSYFQGKHRYRNHDDSIVWVDHIGFAIEDSTGDQRSLLLIAVDVTRKKEAEERDNQSQRMKAIGELAGGVAHDINNVLAIVSAIGHLLKEELEELDLDGLAGDADKMLQAVQRGAALTHQLLSFKQDEQIAQEVIELNSQMADIRELLVEALGKNVKLDFDLEPNALSIELGIGQFEQITMNFVVNARDAMKDGGTLRITTRATHVRSPQTSPRVDLPPGNWAMIEFVDTGTGMDAETQRHVFEPFYTTKAPGDGTGMGLATVYRVVENMGGKIYLDSAPGKGTTFTLYIPVSEKIHNQDLSSKRRKASDSENDKSRGFILLLEDEDDLRKPYRIFLERAGYRVLEAASIEQAQTIFDGHTDEIDLLLADIILPDGSGVELAEQIREVKPELDVIFISGYAPDLVYRNDKTQERKWGFIPKPVSRDKLVSTVDAHFVSAGM